MKIRRQLEIEIKLPVANLAAIRRRLAALGARRLGRVHERNTLLDTRAGRLARRGELLRLRWDGRVATLTQKGPSVRGRRHKVRPEFETRCDDFAGTLAIFAALGFRPGFRYEKYRTTYRLAAFPGLLLDLDETPIGAFLELEGSPRAIDRAARLMGYARADYLTASYADLYRDHCRRKGVRPADMLFPEPKK